LNSTVPVSALVERARQLEMPAVALTDTNGLYAAVEFYTRAREAGIRPIIGAEVDLEDGSSLVLLVKDSCGYKNLCEIITAGRYRGGHLGFRLDPHVVAKHAQGLICLSGGKNSSICHALRRRNRRHAFHQALLWKEVFGEDFYIELQIFQPSDELVATYLTGLASALRIKTVATNDVHMLHPREQEVWRVLRAIDQNTLTSRVALHGSPDQYLKTPAQMMKRFRAFPEAIEHSLEIAEKCHFEFQLGKPIFPAVNLNPGETAVQRLRSLCEQALHHRYGLNRAAAKERMDRELEIIARQGFAEYFLIVKEVVDYCRKENIPCVGRGSAADSIVSYLLGITNVDPIRHELYFERFLNPERSDPPDIDLDICWKRRDQVLHFVYQRYGQDRTAMISTYVTFQLRSSFREIGKALGLPEDELNELTRALPHRGVADFFDAIENVPECETVGQLFSRRKNARAESVFDRILRMARFLSGFPRHLSVHPGGTVIAPERITHYTPLEIARGGIAITQYDMRGIEKLGLVKMDLLGVRSLSILSDTAEMVTHSRRIAVDLNRIPEDDPATLELIRSARTIGCFQLESPGMRGLLRKMRVENLEDIIAAISIIRPGPAEGGMKELYVRRRAGLEKTEYPHPVLEPILRSTYGIILYQEQVLQVAQAIAGLTLGEADILRRAMTKSRDRSQLQTLRDKFMAGATRNGIEENLAAKLWDWLTHFVGYGFNKAHSATYGWLAYQSAYLKTHFPLEFMTAVLNNEGGYYPRFAYVEEARRLGFTILPPSVLFSSAQFEPEGKAIRTGLAAVLDLRQQTVRRILAERRRRPFRDLYDVLLRTGMNQREAENLTRCGAFRELEPSEPKALAKIRIFYKNYRRKHVAELFTRDLQLGPFSKFQRILNELTLLRFAITDHPLTLFLDQNPGIQYVPSIELEKYKNKTVTVVGWVIMFRRVPTQSGAYMKFLTLEDLHGTIEVVLFPDVYKRFGRQFSLVGPLQVTGKIQSRVPGEVNLIAEKITPIRLFTEHEVSVPIPETPFAF
jgi:DNA-directed DNA polymerase III PolC